MKIKKKTAHWERGGNAIEDIQPQQHHYISQNFQLPFRDYAISKRCVLRTVQKGCAVGNLMEEDFYNPFCTDGVDPLSLPSIPGE